MDSVLVINNMDTSRHMAKSVLAHAGFDVLEAKDAFSGAAMLKLRHPKLVIIDPEFTEMTSVDTLEKIRRIDPAAKVLVFDILKFIK